MIAKQIEKFTEILIEKEISKADDKDLIVYGLSTGIELCFNILTTIVLGFLFGLVFESLVFLVSFSLIRTYSGGYHCQKAVNCYLMSSGIVVSVLVIVKFTPKEYMLIISAVLLLFSIPILLKFAPTETLTKPLDDDERKHYRKKMVKDLFCECVVIPVLFAMELRSFGFVVCVGLMVSAGLVLVGQFND